MLNLSLLETLDKLPTEWVLTPVNNKRPYRDNWNTESPVSRSVIASEIKSGKATGYGLITGSRLFCADFDGHSALAKYLEFSDGQEPNYNTVSWTSGKPGRFQLLFRIPEQFLKSDLVFKKRVAIKTGVDNEQLELRYTGHQSVLPPSKHPETGNYQWLKNPWECAIAECPEFLINLLIENNEKPKDNRQSVKPVKAAKVNKQNLSVNSSDIEIDAINSFVDFVTSDKPSLYDFLPHSDRNLIRDGVNDGGRNIAAQKLSINLIATEQRLIELGIQFNDDSETLYYDFCSRCTPALDGLEADKWFSNAYGKNWNPSCDDNVLVDIYEHWINRILKANAIQPESKQGTEQDKPKSKQDSEQLKSNQATKITWLKKRWFENRKISSSNNLEQSEFQLPEMDYQNKLIAIKSGLGTGKTRGILKFLGELCKSIIDNTDNILLVSWVAHRNRLLDQTRAIAHESFGLNFKHINNEKSELSVNPKNDHITSCPESIYKLENTYKGKILVIDEVCGVLGQIVSGGTSDGFDQTRDMDHFKQALDDCLCVIVMDANLRDIDVNLLKKFAPNKELVAIENTKLPRKQNIIFTQSITTELEGGEVKINKRDKSVIISKILEKDCVAAIGVDNLKQSHAFEEELFNFGKPSFVLNKETSNETWKDLFDRNPVVKELLQDKKLDLNVKWVDLLMQSPDDFFKQYPGFHFIYTPTAESGVSIQIQGHFTCKVMCFIGVIGTNSQTQMSLRVRDNSIPTYIYCPERSELPVSSSAPNTKERIAEAFENIYETLQRVAILNQQEFNIHSIEKSLKLARKRIDPDWCDYEIVLKEIDRHEKANLRDCLIHAFTEMGYDVRFEDIEKNQALASSNKEIIKKLKVQESEEIFNAEKFESYEKAKSVCKTNGNKINNRRKSKTWIVETLPGIESSPVWSSDFILETHVKDNKYYNNIENFYLLYNPEILAKQTNDRLFTQISNETKRVNSKSLRKFKVLTINALQELQIPELLEHLLNEGKICKDSEIVTNIIETARANKSINSIDGFAPNKKTLDGTEIIPFIKNLLAKIGVKLKSCDRALDDNGILQRWYCLDLEAYLHPYRKETLAAWNRHFTYWVEHKYKEPVWNPGQSQVVKKPIDSSNLIEFTENLVLDSNPDVAAAQIDFLVEQQSQTVQIIELAKHFEIHKDIPEQLKSSLSQDALGIVCASIDKLLLDRQNQENMELLSSF